MKECCPFGTGEVMSCRWSAAAWVGDVAAEVSRGIPFECGDMFKTQTASREMSKDGELTNSGV